MNTLLICGRCDATAGTAKRGDVVEYPPGWSGLTFTGNPILNCWLCPNCTGGVRSYIREVVPVTADRAGADPAVTDQMIHAFGEAWNATPEGEPGARRRAGPRGRTRGDVGMNGRQHARAFSQQPDTPLSPGETSSKTIQLGEAGSVTISLAVNLFELSDQDSEFVLRVLRTVREFEAAVQRPTAECVHCGGSGTVTTFDGRDLGVCARCSGHGRVPRSESTS